MLSLAQEKLILATHTNKGREKVGLVLVEGEKILKEAREFIEFEFSEEDSNNFEKLVTTQTPQTRAGLARLPDWKLEDCLKKKTVILLDHIQDPGNLGTILRSALAFDASLILVECADIGNPKVIRSSVGSLFHVPWINLKRSEVNEILERINRNTYRLELSPSAIDISKIPSSDALIIVGSEGKGIQLDVKAPSIKISHNEKLESLNAAVATSLLLHQRFSSVTISAQ